MSHPRLEAENAAAAAIRAPADPELPIKCRGGLVERVKFVADNPAADGRHGLADSPAIVVAAAKFTDLVAIAAAGNPTVMGRGRGRDDKGKQGQGRPHGGSMPGRGI